MVPDSVFISEAALEIIKANAFAEAPMECCGLLLGRFAPPPDEAAEAARALERELGLGSSAGESGGFSIPLPDVLTIDDAAPARNASPEPTRYLVEPEDHFRILREARRRGVEIVGGYHSHAITPPVPSETDLAEAQANFLYLIASPDWDTGTRCDYRAWWLVDGNFQEVTIVPVP
jgi:proteasome lid subunit RPN8/RPN11